MNLLNKLTIKNLKLNKKRTLVTIIGIMLSVALITATSSLYASGIQSLIDFEKNRQGDFHVAFYNVPSSEIEFFKNNREIENINLTQNIGYAKINSKNEHKPYAYIKAFTKNSLDNLSIRLIEGKLPENDTEILIPTHLKTNGRLELNVGETITLDVGTRIREGEELNQSNPYYSEDNSSASIDAETGKEIESSYTEESSEEIINTTRITYTIVGIIERPASNIEEYSAPGYTFITYMNENKLTGTFDVYARFTNDGMKKAYKLTANILGIDENLFEKFYSQNGNISEDDIGKLTEEMNNAKYEYNINSYLLGLETNPIGSSSVGGLGVVVDIVIAIIVFTSVFCIKNSFDISITEKTKQYGMLKSIGATKKQIKKNVFYEATILGLVGIPLGILLGFTASYVLIIISNYFLNDMLADSLSLEFSFSVIAVIVAIILGIMTIYFSAFRSAKKASKVSPIDSIRNSGNIKINHKKIKSPKIIKKIFGIGGEISYKNLKRNKKKYRTTVISIVVSVFVFIALSSFMTMAFETIENELNIREANLALSSSNYTEEEYSTMIETTTFDTVEKYAILRQNYFVAKENYYRQEYIDFLNIELDSEIDNYFTIMAIGNYSYNEYIKSLGLDYDEIKNKAILCDYTVINSYDQEEKQVNKYMKVHDLETGDVINGILENGKNYDLEIGIATEKVPFGLEYYSTSQLLIISDEMFDEMFDEITTTDSLAIYYKSSNPNKLQDEIDEYLKDINYNLNNYEENAKIMKNLYTLIGIFLYGFIIVISLIGITNIFNTITTNMQLRRGEFAMLKSIGMTTKEFNRMIRLESLFMGIKSLIFGIPIGIGLSYLIYHFLVKESGMPYKLPIMAIILAVITVFILIFIIMKYSINKIKKQNTIETIRNENI